MEQPIWYEDIISRINPLITIPYIFNKDLTQHNVNGIVHKIQYGHALFDVLLGNPIYLTDNTQNGTIIIYPIYELNKKNGHNRKIGVYEIIPENLPHVYDNVINNQPNVELLGRPYFYNFILHENNLAKNEINQVMRDNEVKYGRGFNWNRKNKIKMGLYDIKSVLNKPTRLNEKAQLEQDEIELRKRSQEARDIKKHNVLEADKIRQSEKFDAKPTRRQTKTPRDNKPDNTGSVIGLANSITNNLFNRTRKKKTPYVIDDSDNWLQKYMKNNKYIIIEDDDVTLFGAVSKLLNESSHDIRERLSGFVSSDDFMKQREIYDKLQSAIKKIHSDAKPETKTLQKLNDSIRDYEYLENIKSFDMFKIALKSIKGNMNILTTIERMYENKYKMLVLKNNKRSTKQREASYEKIVICNNTKLDPQMSTIKKHMQYGLISLDDGKYNAIKYTGKNLMHYGDIPSAIQKRLIDNCINV